MSLEIVKFSFKKSDLSAAPKAERHLFILSGHLLNELNVLGRLLAWTGKYASTDTVLNAGGLINKTTTFSYAVSKGYEGWKLLEKRFTPEIREKYLPKFNPGNKKSYEELEIYFAKQNPIKKLRNSFGFHNYDEWDFILRTFDALPNEDLKFYLHEAPGACVFSMSAETIALCLGKVVDENIADTEQFGAAFNRLVDEVSKITRQLQFVLFDFQVCFINEYLTESSQRTKIILDKLPDFWDVEIPYFVDEEIHKPRIE